MLIDIVSKRYIYFAISLLIIIPGVIALALWGLKVGIDFTGGTLWEVIPIQKDAVDTAHVRDVLSGTNLKDVDLSNISVIKASL